MFQYGSSPRNYGSMQCHHSLSTRSNIFNEKHINFNNKFISYNRIAKRFGQMLVKESYSGEPPYFSTSRNKAIWASLSQAVANTSLFDLGGLHLNQTGKGILAQ
jgi:hypothetical protein